MTKLTLVLFLILVSSITALRIHEPKTNTGSSSSNAKISEANPDEKYKGKPSHNTTTATLPTKSVTHPNETKSTTEPKR